MIEPGDDPTGTSNKFIGPDGTGHRGVLLARSPDKTEAIILGATGEYWGRFVRVVEEDPDQYPVVLDKIVSQIPTDWEIMLPS